MKKLFFGGIHPRYNKEMSTTNTNFQTVLPKQVIIPMQQHIGAPCAPLVQAEDATLVDTSDMTIEEVVNFIVADIRSKLS